MQAWALGLLGGDFSSLQKNQRSQQKKRLWASFSGILPEMLLLCFPSAFPPQLWRREQGELLTREFSASSTLLLPKSSSSSLIMENSLFQPASASRAGEGPQNSSDSTANRSEGDLSWVDSMWCGRLGASAPLPAFWFPTILQPGRKEHVLDGHAGKSSCHRHVQRQTMADQTHALSFTGVAEVGLGGYSNLPWWP